MNRGAFIPVLMLALGPAVPAIHAQTAPPPGQTAAPQSQAPSSQTLVQSPQPPPAALPGMANLDHVVAVVGSDVILQSDVWQEMHFSALDPLRVLPGQNTPASSLRRLIDRTLIMQQMTEQQQPVTTPVPEVMKAVADLRRTIPACEQYHCASDEGWDAFLKANGLDSEEVQERWSQRLAITHFIDLRFRSGIHIASDQISSYYQKTLVPALEKDSEKAPPLDAVSSRIHEILLQQQISGLFQDWLSSLRDQGNVRIVDQAYSADLDTTNANPGNQNQ